MSSQTSLEPAKALGIRIHNLVFTRDSGNDYAEFRVQCEIRLPRPLPLGQTHTREEVEKARNDASRLAVLMSDISQPGALDELEEIVTPYIYGPASTIFKETVHNAIEDNKKDLQGRDD